MKIESNNVRYDRIITEAQHCAYRLSELKHLMSSPFLECEEMDKLIADVSECESKICEVGISIAMIKERLSQMERELITILYGPPPVFSDEEQKNRLIKYRLIHLIRLKRKSPMDGILLFGMSKAGNINCFTQRDGLGP